MAGLADIPFLGAYQQQRALNQQQPMLEMQQASLAATLMSALRKQEQESQLRRALAGAKTPEEQLAVAVRFGGPDAIMKHADRQASLAATKESAMARLKQSADLAQQRHELNLKNITRQQDRDAEIARHNQYMESLQAQAQRLTGERVFYETGVRVPTMQPPGAVAPAMAPDAALPPGVPESDRAAFMMARSGVPAVADRQVTPEEDARMAFVPPSASPAPAPAAAPIAAPAFPPPMPDAGNLDARDIMARQAASAAPGAPAAAPAPSVAPAASTAPVMPPEIASAPKKVQDQWRLQQHKPSIAGAGQLSPDSLRFTARQYLAGDRQAVQGYARNATARIALQNAIVEEAAAQGLSPAQVAAKMAAYAGDVAGARSTGVRSAQIALAATEAEEMIGIVRETSAAFGRTNFVPFNYALKMYDENTGDPRVREFGAALNSLVNVYARAINPTGVPTISDKDHARDLLRQIDSPEQVDAVLKILQRELEIAKRAPETVRDATTARITGSNGLQQYPTATSADGRKVIYKDGRWQAR